MQLSTLAPCCCKDLLKEFIGTSGGYEAGRRILRTEDSIRWLHALDRTYSIDEHDDAENTLKSTKDGRAEMEGRLRMWMQLVSPILCIIRCFSRTCLRRFLIK